MANRNRLQMLFDDLEELLAEKAEIEERIKERKKQAKEDGFSIAVVNTVLRRRKMDPARREEQDALVNLTEAALGMLDGKPLDEAALRRLSKMDDEQPGLFDERDDDRDDEAPPAPVIMANASDDHDDTEDDARRKGAEAAQAGAKITANPYPPRSAQRAAWDEAWCQTKGSDGMEIPAAFKPTPKPKKPKKGDDGNGGDSGEGAGE